MHLYVPLLGMSLLCVIVRADLDLAPAFSVLVSAYSWLREQVAGSQRQKLMVSADGVSFLMKTSS